MTSPESVVQRQLDAYNARDVDACWRLMQTTHSSSSIQRRCLPAGQHNCASALPSAFVSLIFTLGSSSASCWGKWSLTTKR